MNEDRIEKLKKAMSAQGMDYAILIPGSNMKYFLGFSPMLTRRAALAIFSSKAKEPVLVLPSLEAPNARLQTDGKIKIFEWDDGKGAAEAVKQALQKPAGQLQIGVEFTFMRVQELKVLEKAFA